jgi:hypothetical protein
MMWHGFGCVFATSEKQVFYRQGQSRDHAGPASAYDVKLLRFPDDACLETGNPYNLEEKRPGIYPVTTGLRS